MPSDGCGRVNAGNGDSKQSAGREMDDSEMLSSFSDEGVERS